VNETTDIAALVDAHRLVTLIGPAGVGKTRLGLHVASSRAGTFANRARLADLAPVGPELVADTVARALGTRRGQLSGAGAGGAEYPRLGSSCRRRDDAVRLFIDRAAAASPGFTLTDALAPAVSALCQRLDGLPLAIELAAARVRSYGPLELTEHLDERFDLLSAGARTALPRHRTLRGAIDWSYELLDDDERALFSRLGVFPADLDYEAGLCARRTIPVVRP
jgi:predicted ATPase